MSLIIKTSTFNWTDSSGASSHSTVLSSHDLEIKINQAFVKWMKEMNDEFSTNKAKVAKEPERIRQGMWYPNEHFQAINARNNRYKN